MLGTKVQHDDENLNNLSLLSIALQMF